MSVSVSHLKRVMWLAAAVTWLPIAASTPQAFAQEGKKPNILFIMGDDIGWMQPSIYHRGLMVGETPNIDRIGAAKARFSPTMSPCKAAPPGATRSSRACIRFAPA